MKGQNKDKRSNGTYTKNYILHGLQELNLIKNKHIPTNYLYNTKEVRKSLLAGIIDTDGCIDTKRHRYEITLKTSQLSDDVITLSRSLGYKVYVSKKKVKAYENNDYTRITIYGDLSDLPIQLPRKKQTYKVLKDYSKQWTRPNIYKDMEKEESKVKSCYIHIPFCNKICSYCDFAKIYYNKLCKNTNKLKGAF